MLGSFSKVYISLQEIGSVLMSPSDKSVIDSASPAADDGNDNKENIDDVSMVADSLEQMSVLDSDKVRKLDFSDQLFVNFC